MANLFIGFPVPRAKIALMIEGAAPPLEHIDNHLPGGSDPIVATSGITTDQMLKWDGEKFIGADPPAAGGVPSPITVNCAAFGPRDDTVDFDRRSINLNNRTSLTYTTYYANVCLPHGVTITKLTLSGYRDNEATDLYLGLLRVRRNASESEMVGVDADWTDGNGSGEETSISYATIDNTIYSYALYIDISPTNSVGDCVFYCAQIDFS